MLDITRYEYRRNFHQTPLFESFSISRLNDFGSRILRLQRARGFLSLRANLLSGKSMRRRELWSKGTWRVLLPSFKRICPRRRELLKRKVSKIRTRSSCTAAIRWLMKKRHQKSYNHIRSSLSSFVKYRHWKSRYTLKNIRTDYA